MLELPESATIAKQLQSELAGHRIQRVIAGFSPHGFAFYTGDPADYPARLEGRRIDAVAAAGGQVEIIAEDRRILFMDGVNVRYLAPGDAPPKKHQLYLELDSGAAIACSIQMYGSVQAYAPGEMDDNFYYQVARDKPSPLSADFDEAYFDNLWRSCKPSMSAKAFLATEQRIPGLGNGSLQDILYHAKVHPKSKLQDLTQEDQERLFCSVKETLEAMVVAGGRDTEKDIYGNPGGYRCALSKNTLPYPCTRCRSGVRKQSFLGGAVYFCPVCQPEL